MANVKEVQEELENMKREIAGAKPVSYIVFESSQARLERTIKRLVSVILVLIIFLVSTNAIWSYEFSKFQKVETTQEVAQDSDL